MTLRRFHLILATIACTLSIAAAVALVSLAHSQANATAEAAEATRSLGAAERLQLHLLRHNRNSYLALLTGEPRYADAAASLESAITKTQDVLSDNAETAEERVLVESVGRRVRIYMDVHHGARPNAEPIALYLAAQQYLEDAYDATSAVSVLSEQQSANSLQRAERGRRWALGAGGAMAVFVLAGTTAAIFAARGFIYRPLLALEGAIRDYSLRNGDSRAPESGPEELRAIGRTFNEMAAEISRRRERELTFLAGIAHDLRTPLTHLKLLVGSFATPDLPPERLHERLFVATRQVEHLDRMVGDLLDMARIEAGRLEIRVQSVDLTEEVRRIAALFDTGTNPVRVDAPPELPAICDPFRISQVLANLLSNAQKYSPPGGSIEIAIERRPGEAEIRIADHGIGVPEDERERIFQPFQRSTASRTGGPSGSGLGLSVARRIVEAHGGRIWAEEAPGGGALIRIRLPNASNHPGPPGPLHRRPFPEPPHASP